MIDFSKVLEVNIPEGIAVKISVGDKVLWERPGLLPSAYQQVSYIETDGNQYIDTGVLASNYSGGIRYVFNGHITGYDPSGTNHYLFGCLNNGKRSGNVSFNDNLTGKPFIVYIGGSSSNIFRAPAILNKDILLEAFCKSSSIDDLKAMVNNVSFTRSDGTYTPTEMPNANIYLLWCNGVGSTSIPIQAKLYYFTMDAADGTPIRNFIPCYRKNDGEIGLYDTVDGIFYSNQGSGTFSKGADI